MTNLSSFVQLCLNDVIISFGYSLFVIFTSKANTLLMGLFIIYVLYCVVLFTLILCHRII